MNFSNPLGLLVWAIVFVVLIIVLFKVVGALA